MNASASFVAKANPLNRAPHKRKSELHHALCNMLSNILAPLADGGKGQWPPTGVEPALQLWFEAIGRIRLQLMHWMDKQNKHIAVSGCLANFIIFTCHPMPSAKKVLYHDHLVIQVGYPLVTILLCLGDPQIFHNNLSSHMEQLYRHLRVSSNLTLTCLVYILSLSWQTIKFAEFIIWRLNEIRS